MRDRRKQTRVTRPRRRFQENLTSWSGRPEIQSDPIVAFRYARILGWIDNPSKKHLN